MSGNKKERPVTKRALLTSAMSLVLCFVMLIASTFAWFTDSVSNKDNTIQAGNLKISAIGYDKDRAFYSGNGDLATATNGALINELNFAPGNTGYKYVKVTNDGSLDAYIDLSLITLDGKLNDVAMYKISGPENDFQAWGDITWSDPTFWDDAAMFGVNSVKSATDPIAANGGFGYYRIDYMMCPGAGNTYQNQKLLADIVIVASQELAVVNYIYTAQDLIDAVSNPLNKFNTIILMDNIKLDADLTVTVPVNLDLNGFTIDATGSMIFYNIAANETCAMDIANGTIKANAIKFDAPSAVVNIAGTLVFDGAIESTSDTTVNKLSNFKMISFGGNPFNTSGNFNMGAFAFELAKPMDISLASLANGNGIMIDVQMSLDDKATWISHNVRSSGWSGIFEIDGANKYPKLTETDPEYIDDVLPAGVILRGNETRVNTRYSDIYNAIKDSTTNVVYVRTVFNVYEAGELVEVVTFPAFGYTNGGATAVGATFGIGDVNPIN